MKVEINNKEQNTEIKFPCLMQSKISDLIILATSFNGKSVTGTVLTKDYLGTRPTTLDKSIFKPFTGSITLSNE
jgi:hypothetical protein